MQEPIALAFKREFPEIPVLILQLLNNRGLKTQKQITEFLQPDYGQDLLDPFLFTDMAKAVDRVYEAVANKEKVAIYGDYDADGVTSTVVMANILKNLGLDFEVYIPHREKDGYGLNSAAMETAAADGVKLGITVDNGITAHAELARARDLGLAMIVTDHHEPDGALPPSDTVPASIVVIPL